jgi:hypothetical protein
MRVSSYIHCTLSFFFLYTTNTNKTSHGNFTRQELKHIFGIWVYYQTFKMSLYFFKTYTKFSSVCILSSISFLSLNAKFHDVNRKAWECIDPTALKYSTVCRVFVFFTNLQTFLVPILWHDVYKLRGNFQNSSFLPNEFYKLSGKHNINLISEAFTAESLLSSLPRLLRYVRWWNHTNFI